ncbi:MAG: sugar transporter [Desulfuromonas sp.]|nr:sugar transporter [Desulfuromonas sp.]
MKRCTLPVMLLAGLSLLLGGCFKYTNYEPGTVIDIDDQSKAILALQEVSVPPPPVDPTESVEYRVGPGDVLSVTVPGLLERGNGEGKGSDTLGGFRVYTSGKVLLPLVGGVEVAGLTVEQIQTKLVEVFSAYIKQPVVSVEIVEFKSQPLYLLGKFNKPGLVYLDRPTSLLHGLALGNGLADQANLRGARVVRNDKVLPVDIYQLLYNNDLRQNIQLRQGDAIYVPGNEAQQVFVLGTVNKPGAVPMVNGRLNLVQALSAAGLDGKAYDEKHVRLIRTISPTHGQLMMVDLGRMMNGQALPLPLNDGDIVFVPKTGLGGWNEIISELLPTFQLIGAVAQPFLWADAINND